MTRESLRAARRREVAAHRRAIDLHEDTARAWDAMGNAAMAEKARARAAAARSRLSEAIAEAKADGFVSESDDPW